MPRSIGNHLHRHLATMAELTFLTSDLSDDEVDAICRGLTQNAAKTRFLRTLGLRVDRKPNGAPLINRAHYDAVRGGGRRDREVDSDGPVWGVHR